MSTHVHVFEPRTEPGGRTLVLLHGTGGNERDLLGLGRVVDPKANLLGVRGNVLENGMPRFFRRHAEGVFDEDDVRRRAKDLSEFLVSCASLYGLDPARAVAIGYSNGANVAAAMMLLGLPGFSGAALLRAMRPLSRVDAVHQPAGRSVLMVNGSADPIVPEANAAELARDLQRIGASVERVVLKAGHQLTRDDVRAVAAWIAGPA